MEWRAEVEIQIGAYDAPPPGLSAFLAGYVGGLTGHAAVLDAEILGVDAFAGRVPNPARRVGFRFLAESRSAAERLAADRLLRAALQAGTAALEPGQRGFGWTVSIDVQPV